VPTKLDQSAVDRAEEVFRNYLRERGLKATSERQTLVRAILSSQEHFEPEDLLVSLRQQGIRVGKATIYRTLPLLVDAGILRRAFVGHNRAYYEHCLGATPHDHMICTNCGRVFEFDSSDILQIRERLASQASFTVQSHRFQIAGLCRDCKPTPLTPLGTPGQSL
jgi:Fur family transcriptional regulator, ferric uptake regulator